MMKLSAEIQKFGAPAVGLTLNQFYEEETMHKGLSEGWCTYRDSQVEIQRERARERERERTIRRCLAVTMTDNQNKEL